MTIGTGIGGGLILDGKLYHGASDVAGEVGHTTIDSTGRRCKCGNYGCLEAYASGPAIAERAREALAGGDASLLARPGRRRPVAAHGAHRLRRRRRGAISSRGEIVRETARFLGTGVANLLNIFNPDVVVLAGGVTHAGDALFDPAARPKCGAARFVRRSRRAASSPARWRERPASSARSRRSRCRRWAASSARSCDLTPPAPDSRSRT